MGFGFRGNPLLGYWKRMCEQPTAAEKSIEPAIAALGEPYRVQHPFWDLKYFADFALLNRKLIIEVDGDSHDRPAQKEKDLLHELAVLKLGWRVARISNGQALSNPAEAVKVALIPGSLPSKESRAEELMAQLARLHQSYPHLLEQAAKTAKRRRQSALVGAQKRAAKKASGAYPPRKRAVSAQSLQ